MFKYKDLRMVVISIILVILCAFSGIYFRYDRMKLVVVLLLALGVLPTLLIRFNASVFEDALLVYFSRNLLINKKMDRRLNLLSIFILIKFLI